jgi:hypothetical protein
MSNTYQRFLLTACMYCMLGMSGCATSKFTDEPGYPFAPIISRLVDNEGYPFFGRTPLEDAKQAYAWREYLKAFKIFKLLAEQGNVEAQYQLGKMYQNPFLFDGVPYDKAEGDKWIARSSMAVKPHGREGSWQLKPELATKLRPDSSGFLSPEPPQQANKNPQPIGMVLVDVVSENSPAFEADIRPRDILVSFNGTAIRSAILLQESMRNYSGSSIDLILNRDGNLIQKTVAVRQKSNTPWIGVIISQGTLATPQAQAKASPPQLVFSSSLPRNDGSVELNGRVSSSANISEVSINGRTLEVPLAKDGSFKVIRGLQIGVVTTYRLSVMDEFGQRADASVTAERTIAQYVDEVVPLDPRKMKAKINQNAIALIIGVESYSSLPPAQYADSDASHFYDYANQALGVPTNKIKLLTNAKATRADLLMAMKSWMRTEIVFGWSDVYIFFAGHGLANADGSKTYLLPADGRRELLDETSILRDDLIASAKGARTITMFLDTCYSGGTRTNELLLADARPIAIVPDRSALPLNVTVLAAASGAQLSSTYEAAQQGLFSYWLMKGLEGDADINRDRKITTGELHQYASKNVGPIAQRRNREQSPQLMGDSTRVLVNY